MVSPAKAFIVVGRPGVFPDSDMSIVGRKVISQASIKAVEVARRETTKYIVSGTVLEQT